MYLYLKEIGLQYAFSIALSIISVVALSLVLELTIFKFLRKKVAHPFVLLITSLGLYIIIQNIISILWGDDLKLLNTGPIEIGYNFFGANITGIQLLIIFLSPLLIIGTFFYLNKSKCGKQIRAVSSNEQLSTVFGVNSNITILLTYTIGSSLAAIAGILVALDVGMTPNIGFNLLVYGMVAMIIGGIGNIWGLFAGSFLLASVQHFASFYIGSKWMDAIAYLILIIFLIWRPLGFSGQRLKKIEI